MSVVAAIRARDATSLPGKRDEAWRWTDLRGLIREVPARSEALDTANLTAGPFDALVDETVVIANGGAETRISVAAGVTRVIGLRIVSRGSGAHTGRAVISVAPGGHLTLLETYEGDEGGYLSQMSLTLDVGGALERVVLAQDGLEGVTVSQTTAHLRPGAVLGQTTLTAGGRRQRIETHVDHPGGHAALRLDGVYLLQDKAHADLSTVVTHGEAHGSTEQLTKGMVSGQARGVFQGRIIVTKGADQTDARMGHHALILSERAEVDAKPELEIYADDVSCAHGNTVGALDEAALFYAAQRGIPEDEARVLLTEAFIGEVIDRIGHDGARDIARAWAADRLRPS